MKINLGLILTLLLISIIHSYPISEQLFKSVSISSSFHRLRLGVKRNSHSPELFRTCFVFSFSCIFPVSSSVATRRFMDIREPISFIKVREMPLSSWAEATPGDWLDCYPEFAR